MQGVKNTLISLYLEPYTLYLQKTKIKPMSTEATNTHVDVIIIGAGLSGIGAAHHLQEKCPDRTYMILEGRANMGGTWDLFKYPGIRSDSDMHTLGYDFRPWKDKKAIADGPAILKYVKETAREGGIDKHIKYNHRVNSADFSTEKSQWAITAFNSETNQNVTYTCNFIFACGGYYSYKSGYMPDFDGTDEYSGQLVHPQKWPEGLDYTDKKVVVIGSGATAMTLVPEMAKKAEKVTMLQRSPTYIITKPSKDVIANVLNAILPAKISYFLVRWKNILMGIFFYWLCQRFPDTMRNFFVKGVKNELGEDFDVEKHFKPSYNPWNQRVCLVPDSDLFQSLKAGTSDVVTDHIDKFVDKGILLKSGETLEADVVVSATGLQLEIMSNIDLSIDGKLVHAPDLLCYRGMMFSDLPNLAMFVGYTNASWTLKTDLTATYACRLLNHMKKTGTTQCIPRIDDPTMEREPIIDFSSGYVLRALDKLPKQGSKSPWKLYQNYIYDVFNFRYSSLKDKSLEFK